MPGGQSPNPKISLPAVPQASSVRPGPLPTRIVTPQYSALPIGGVHPPAQNQRRQPVNPLVRTPAVLQPAGPVARVSAPPVYRPIMAAQIQSKAVTAVKAPVPPPVFRPQTQGLSPKPGSIMPAPLPMPGSSRFQNQAAVQRMCLFSSCFGGGSGDG